MRYIIIGIFYVLCSLNIFEPPNHLLIEKEKWSAVSVK